MSKVRPLWLWPLSILLVWLLILPLGCVIYASLRPGFFIPEVQRHLAPLGRSAIVIPWTVAAALLTAAGYWSSHWKKRRRRPRAALVLLMLAWSALLGAWWHAVNRGALMTVGEWLFMAAFVAGPPGILLGLEALVGEVVFARGMRLFQRGDPVGATRLLRLAESIRPGEAAITRAVGLALFRAREWEAAQEWLERARQAYPRDTELAWPLAALALRRRAWAEAIPHLKQHLEANPRDDNALERLTEAHLALGDLDRAIRAFEQIQRPGDVGHLMRLAELYLRRRDHERALAIAKRIRALERLPWPRSTEIVERVLQAQPTMIPALEQMIVNAQELNRPDEVQRWRERLLALRPDDIALRRQVMQHCRDTHNLVALEGHLRHILEGPSPTREDLAEMVDLLLQRRAWDQLPRWLELAKEHHPEAWEFLLAEAQVALAQRQWDRSFQLCHMARARALGPEALRRIDALLARLARARSEDQLAALREAIAGAADPMPLRWELVERLTEMRAFDLVVTELDEILRRDPAQQGRVASALDQLLRDNPENFTLLNYLRDLLMREGAHDAVFRTSERLAAQSLHPDQVMREWCERILQVNPDHVLSLRWLAEHAHRSGDWQSAPQWFERWFRADPAAGEEVENLQRLFEALAGAKDLERGQEVAQRLIARRHREVENLKTLARLHEHHGQLAEAHRCFLLAREIDNQDREIHEAIATLDREMRLDRVHELELQLEKEPDNTALHCELGDLLYGFERHTEAIPHLQRAAADPAIANLCRAKIAHSLALRGMMDLAHETLTEVTLNEPTKEQMETVKAIVYSVAQIFLDEGQRERALEAFKRIFRVDAGYRDVVQILERLTR